MESQGTLRDGERYELLGELASGGMATVYLARMRRPLGFSRLVAIKCMHPQFAKDPSFVSMFLDEARLTARLRHPNIVPTLDIVHDDGHLLLVMEYVEGASLAHLLRSVKKQDARIPVPIACAIVHDMLLGLHEAHHATDDDNAPLAIVHRDVSPQNVLVGVDGLARVLDFGVEKARQNTHRSNDNEIKGKIPYMPPEQLFGEAFDHKVDVYAAGVTLWEALVCERLFDGPSETALVRKISEEPIARPSTRVTDLAPEIDAIVMKALSRDANDRYESALAMAEAIAAVIKLPTRTEVSAWVRQFVAPREIPSARRLPAIAEPDDATATMLALLEKASMLRPSAKRPAPTVAPRAARTTRLAIGVAAFAIGVAGIAVARVAKSESAQTHTGAVTTTAATKAAIATEPVERPAMQVPVIVPTIVEDSPAPPVQQPARTAARTTRPAARAAAPAVVKPALHPTLAAPEPAAAAAPVAAPDPKPSCKIPYTIDSDGHKHYKVECI